MPSLATSYLSKFIVTVCTITMCCLGIWQLYRADAKSERLDKIAQIQQASAYHLNQVLQSTDPRDLPVRISGYVNAEQFFFIDNKLVDGKLGYYVVVPIETSQGPVLVNFGWVQGNQNRQVLPQVNLPKGEIELTGMVSVPKLNPFINETKREANSWPLVLQQVDVALVNSLLERKLLPIVILLDEQEDIGFIRNWQPVVMPPEKHIAYAVQWFGLAIACLAVFIAASRKNKEEKHVE